LWKHSEEYQKSNVEMFREKTYVLTPNEGNE